MVPGQVGQLVLHRAMTAGAESSLPVIQQRPARKALEWNDILIANRGPCEDHYMQGSSQAGKKPFILGASDAAEVCCKIEKWGQGRMKSQNYR